MGSDHEYAAAARGTSAPHPLDSGGVVRSYVKLGLLVVFVGVAVMVARFVGGQSELGFSSALRELEAETPNSAPFLFVGASAILIAVGAPRLVFCALAGMLFGFVKGLALVQIATVGGAWATFCFSRWTARDWVRARVGRMARLAEGLGNPSIRDVFVVRQFPITGAIITLVLGTSRVGHGTFLVGSFFGFLPAAVVFTLLGSGLMEESTVTALSRVWGTIPVLALVAFLAVRMARRFQRRAATDSASAVARPPAPDRDAP